MSNTSTSDKLKIARKHLGKDQKEMAGLCNMAHRSWQRYEQDEGLPSGKVFEALAMLGFNVNWFFSDDVPMLTKDQIAEGVEQETSSSPAPAQPSTTTGAIPDDDIGLGESVELLAKIYNSGNPVLIRAIAANLHAFSEAVDNKALAMKTISMMEEMNQRVLFLEKELERMKSEEDGRAAATA